MRIIAGSLKGRIFNSKGRPTHPMSEKARGALFNSLGDIVGLSLLDAFAGTGAISFEAISRGASFAVAIESSKIAQDNIQDNIRYLGLEENIRLARSTFNSWMQRNHSKTFDLIVCDPPYDKLPSDSILQVEDFLEKTGVLVLSYPPQVNLPDFRKLVKIDEKKYGDCRLVFYRNNQ